MIDSSPESSFRELDDVFLQTQTRIWLGELLNMRLDEDLPLSDLLQDGEILFEVSKLVWDMLLTKCMELRHLKHKYGPFGSKKSSGRYRPYSNVDSFLKICKILGLSGIDLFSPSDIVEKRDIRKVCICIRALSKKTRSKQLSVPDFDMVRYSVTMPTDMVGIIRKSLELSQCTFSSSSSYGSQLKLKQKNLHTPSNRDDDFSSSEESDEAESYMGENSFSSGGKLEYADGISSDLENLPETRPTSGQDRRQNVENDGSFMGDSSCIDVGENNYITDYLAFSDLMVHATDASNSVVVDGENNMFDFFLNVDSQKTTSGKRSFHSEDEDMEVSSTTSMSSVLCRLLNLEFENQFDEEDSLSSNVHPSVSKEHDDHYRDSFVLSKPREDTYDSQSHNIVFDSEKAQSDMGPRLLNSKDKCEMSSMESLKRESYDAQLCNRSVVDNQDGKTFHEVKDAETVRTTMLGSDSQFAPVETYTHSCVVETSLGQTMAENHRSLHLEDKNTAQEDSHVALTSQHNISSDAENGSQDKRKHDRRPLLKTVVKGTAIAGVLFILLHINKPKGNETTKNAQISKSSFTKLQVRRGGNGRYPTENIKF